jgi:hypothetical protein
MVLVRTLEGKLRVLARVLLWYAMSNIFYHSNLVFLIASHISLRKVSLERIKMPLELTTMLSRHVFSSHAPALFIFPFSDSSFTLTLYSHRPVSPSYPSGSQTNSRYPAKVDSDVLRTKVLKGGSC